MAFASMRGWFVKKEEPEESLAANWQGEALLARRRQMRMSGDPQVEVQAPTRRSGEEARNISRAPEDAARNTIRATGMSCQGCDTQDNPSASMLTDILAKGMADSPSGEHNLKASSFKQRLGALKVPQVIVDRAMPSPSAAPAAAAPLQGVVSLSSNGTSIRWELLPQTKAYLCMGAAGAAGVKDSDPRLYASRVQQLRARIWRFMNMPDSSALAFLTSLLIMAVIVVSTASFCLETLDHFNNPKAISKFKAVETVCIIIFTLEYLLKLFTAPDLRRFLKQPMNVVDLAAIAPWYLGLILSSSKAAGTRILRVLRLVRIMRIFKLGGRYGKAQVIMRAIVESADVLGIMLFLLSLTVVIFSTLIYYCEKGVYDPALGFQVRAGDKDAAGNPRETPFNSIPASFWWCIVTLMTVGYGDMVPITTAGKVVAGIEMLWCLLCLALPISVIGTNFTQEWLLYQERMKERGSDKEMVPALAQLAELITHHHTNLEDLVKKFTEATIDLDAKCARLKDRIRAQRRDAALQKHNLSTAQTPTSRTSTRRLLRFLRRNFDTEMRELEERMLEQSDWLADLLTINDFFHTDECEDKVKNCRSKYKQIEVRREASQSVKLALEETAAELRDVKTFLDDCAERWQRVHPDPGADPGSACASPSHAGHSGSPCLAAKQMPTTRSLMSGLASSFKRVNIQSQDPKSPAGASLHGGGGVQPPKPPAGLLGSSDPEGNGYSQGEAQRLSTFAGFSRDNAVFPE